MKKEELYEEYETITIEKSINIMTQNHGEDPSSYILRDTNGEVVTDPKAIKTVQDAMAKIGDRRFEYGGNFKAIKDNMGSNASKKYIVGMTKKPNEIIEYCPCCGEPILDEY